MPATGTSAVPRASAAQPPEQQGQRVSRRAVAVGAGVRAGVDVRRPSPELRWSGVSRRPSARWYGSHSSQTRHWRQRSPKIAYGSSTPRKAAPESHTSGCWIGCVGEPKAAMARNRPGTRAANPRAPKSPRDSPAAAGAARRRSGPPRAARPRAGRRCGCGAGRRRRCHRRSASRTRAWRTRPPTRPATRAEPARGTCRSIWCGRRARRPAGRGSASGRPGGGGTSHAG